MSTLNSMVIYGGSFDPVTNAHIEIIKKLSSLFEKVVVVPTNISPFKKRGAVANSIDRVVMLKKSLSGLNNVEVSNYEINKDGISFTIDTVKYFKEEYNMPIYIAIGSEMLKKLNKWHDFDTLKTMVRFFVITRSGFEVKKGLKNRLEKQGADLWFSEFDGLNYSSSLAKVDAVFGKFDNIPVQAVKIIKDKNLYSEYNNIVKEFKAFNLDDERIEHIYRTTVAAVELAKIHNANLDDVIKAALLHDIAKSSKELNIDLPSEYTDAPKNVIHSFMGAELVKTHFKIKKRAIVDAVRYHTTGHPKMSKLAKLIFLADAVEPSRDIENEDTAELRALSKKSLNKAMVMALQMLIEYIQSKGREVYHLTFDTLSHFLNPPQKSKIKMDSLSRGEYREPAAVPQIDYDANDLARKIAKFLDDKKGFDIVLIDLNGKTIVADYFVIASANSTTQVKALTEFVDEKLSKDYGIEPLRRDSDNKWAAIDYGSVIMHIQLKETREFYNLERLWSDGSNLIKYS